MSSAKRLVRGEWKIWFEAVMLEIRNGYFKEAENMVVESLQVHNATGRLWATLIQLQHARSQSVEDFETTYKTFIKSLHEIPKSGEVWCEGARLHMSRHTNNRKYLEFAIQFTPQYGDSFLELLRLYLIMDDKESLAELNQYCIHAEPNYGVLWFFYKNSILDNAVDIWQNAKDQMQSELATPQPCNQAPKTELMWMGSQRMIKILRKGMKGCSFEEKVKIVYGFEQVLPQIAYL